MAFNESKCKTLENEYMDDPEFKYRLGGTEMHKVLKLKDLGVGLSSKGTKAHDKQKRQRQYIK